MAASKTYVTNIAIGAKVLSSFSGAMSAAQNRMKELEKSVNKVSSSIKAMTGLMVGALAALGGRAIFSKIFEGAEEGAKAAEQATQKMIGSLMQLKDINEKGRGYAEAQVKELQKHTEELAKHSIYSKEILNAGEAQMTVAAIPPKYIKQAIGPMQDLLALQKGVSATQEDMANFASAFGNAIKTGMTKPLKQFGIILSPQQKAYVQFLSKTGQYTTAYNFLLERMSYAAGEAERKLKTPEGRIMKAQQKIHEMGIRIRNALLPDRAELEEAWTAAMLGLEPILTWFEQLFTHVMTWAAKEFGDLVARLQQPDGVNAMNDFAKAVEGVGAAFGITEGKGKSLGTMLGDWLVKEIQQTTQDFIGIERVVMNLQRHWKIFEGEFIGGWNRITEAIGKAWEKVKNFFKSITEWKPPWWMPGVRAAVSSGQAIYKGGGGARQNVWDTLKSWNAAATARVGGGGGGALGNLNLPAAPARAGGGGSGGSAPAAAAAVAPIAAAASPTATAAAAATPYPTSKAARGPALYNKLLAAYQNSGVVGKVPPDGAKFGITTGSAEEWARFGTAVASAESGFNPKSALASDPGGSWGVFQYSHPQAYGNAWDVNNSVRAFVRDSEQSLKAGSIHKGYLGRRFSTIGSHPDRTMAKLGQAAAIASQVQAASAGATDANKPPPLLASVPGMQFGGIATRPMLAQLAERGAEAVIPLGRGGRGVGGMLGHMLNFSPNVTVHGGSSMTEAGLVSKLRDLSREFVDQFKRAQHHERRLSYEGGYG